MPEWQRAAIETFELNMNYQSDFRNESQKGSTEAFGAHWCPRMTVLLSEQSYLGGQCVNAEDIQHCYFSNKPRHTEPAEEVQQTWVLAVAG